MPHPRSLVWDSFTKLDISSSRCNQCSIIVKTKNFSTTGLRAHMRRKHPKSFHKMENLENHRKSNTSFSPEEHSPNKDIDASSSDKDVHGLERKLAFDDKDVRAAKSFVKSEDFSFDEGASVDDFDSYVKDTLSPTASMKSVDESGYTEDIFNEDRVENEIDDLMKEIGEEKKDMTDTVNPNLNIDKILSENAMLKRNSLKSKSEINFLEKVNFLLLEMKELKNENEQLKSEHQFEISQLKKKHKQQLAKLTSLLAEFNYE